MSFPIALSGLNAASADLSVTAHNVSNAATLGFKEGRIEFAEVYQSGVRVADTRQQFTPGNIEFTGNNLDLAISGDGFFTVSDNGSLLYSRAGAFGVDPDGYVVNSAEQRLQVYPPQGAAGVFDTGALQDLRLTTGQSAPNQTGTGELGVNLPANSSVPTSAVFDPTDPGSFNHSTSTTIYDSLGESHNASWYFAKDAAANTWNSYLYVDGAAVGGPVQMQFDANGALSVPAGGFVTYPPFDPGTGADPLNMQFDMNGSTSTAVTLREQCHAERLPRPPDGHRHRSGGCRAGALHERRACRSARWRSRFPNPQGLQPQGDNTWAQTFASGELRGAPARPTSAWCRRARSGNRTSISRLSSST
jgi:flagellar hook protein FlgE